MDWFFILCVFIATGFVKNEGKPLYFDAYYPYDDLLAEESQPFATVYHYYNQPQQSYGYHYPTYYRAPSQHYYHQQAVYGPYYMQSSFQNPHYRRPLQPLRPSGRYPHLNGKPTHTHAMSNYPVQPESPKQNNSNMPPTQYTNEEPHRPTNVVPNTTNIPTQSKSTTSIQPMQPQTGSTETIPILSKSPKPIAFGSTSTTTEEPVYDIDIRINDK